MVTVMTIAETCSSYPADLGKALAKRGLSQADLSRATNIHPSSVSTYVRGLKPSPEQQRRIAEALGELRDGVVS